MEITCAKSNKITKRPRLDALVSDDLINMEKMVGVDDNLVNDVSFIWFDAATDVTIELDDEPDTLEQISMQPAELVVKTEPPDDEHDDKKDIKKEFDESSGTKDELIRKITDLKSDFEVKDEIKTEEDLDQLQNSQDDDVWAVTRVEKTPLCNPSNEPYHYCPKCSYKCTLPGCGFITKSKNVFETHKKYVVHQNAPKRLKKNYSRTESSDPDLLRCTYCPFTTKRKDLLRNHIKDCESKIVKQVKVISNCQECGFALNKNTKTCKKCGWRVENKSVLPQKFDLANNKRIKLAPESTTTNYTSRQKSKHPVKENIGEKLKTTNSTSKISLSSDTKNVINCEFCNFNTTQKNLLAAHVLKECKGVLELANNAENNFSKPTKKRVSTSSETSLLEPDSTTDEHEVIQCNFCAFEATTHESLTNHMKMVCKDYKKWLESSSSFVAAPNLNKHEWKCHFCSFHSPKMETLLEHMKHECPNFDGVCCRSAGMANCSKCTYIARSKSDLVKHLVYGKCSDNPQRKCNYCSFVTEKEEELVSHVMKDCNNFLKKCEEISSTDVDDVNCDPLPTSVADKKKLVIKCPKKIKCKFCNFLNVRIDTVIQHALYECKNTQKAAHEHKIRTMFVEKDKLKCHVFKCAFRARTRQEMSQHHHDTFECRYCPFKCKTEWPYKAHLWKHEHGGTCETCGKKFKTMGDYNNHVATHNEVYFECPWCPTKVSNKKALMDHKRLCKYRDTEYCDNCNFKTIYEYFMNSHKKFCRPVNSTEVSECTETVSNVKLSCSLCSHKNCSKSEMVKHYTSAHNVFQCVLYKCKQCTFKTQDLDKFNKHYVEDHSQSPKVIECPMCLNSESEDLVEYRWHYLQHFVNI